MPAKLTAASVERLQPDPEKRIEISDGLLPALRVIVQPSGAKTFAVRYRMAGRPAKHTIGSIEHVSLAEAREAARNVLIQAARGVDPAVEKRTTRAAKAAEAKAADDLVERQLEAFLDRHVGRLKSAGHVRPMLRKEVTPWFGRRVQDVGRRDVIQIVEAIHDRGSPTTARRVLANLRVFFSWMVEREVLSSSPCSGVKAPSTEVHRDRMLADDELRLVWMAAGRLGYPFEPFVKMLILTGCRREEVAGMRWEEADLIAAEWRLPPSRTKNGRAHTVFLAPQAMTLLAAVPRIPGPAGRPIFVFSATGKTGISGFSRAKTNIDRHIADLQREEATARGHDPARVTHLAPWRWHDLRRSFASGCARIGIALPVVERALNHISGSFGGIVGVYQQHGFEAEKRAAFSAWANHVLSLASAFDQKISAKQDAKKIKSDM